MILKKIVNITGLTLNIIAIAALIISGLSMQISPEKFVLPAFFGLTFPFFVIANFLFVIYWALKFKWMFVLSAIALLFEFNNIRIDSPFNKEKSNKLTVSDTSKTISLLSYNVKLFNFYSEDKGAVNHNFAIDYILDRDADIVCLQEFGFYDKKPFLTSKHLLGAFAEKYKYHNISYHMNRNDKSCYGIATFSKYPIINKMQIEYGSNYNHTTYSDINVKGTTIRLFNCHLESNQLTLDDKKKMMELVDRDKESDISGTTGLFIQKLAKAYKNRAHQADVTSKIIGTSPYETIVCGDFNDTPISYTYHTMRGDLHDAFVDTSTGFGISYNEFPFLYRIDYILHSDGIEAGNFRIGKVKYSDHYPISCNLDIRTTDKGQDENNDNQQKQ